MRVEILTFLEDNARVNLHDLAAALGAEACRSP